MELKHRRGSQPDNTHKSNNKLEWIITNRSKQEGNNRSRPRKSRKERNMMYSQIQSNN